MACLNFTSDAKYVTVACLCIVGKYSAQNVLCRKLLSFLNQFDLGIHTEILSWETSDYSDGFIMSPDNVACL
jgi:hypothetical protein